MLRKLYKYEFSYMFKIMGLYFIILAGITVFSAVINKFDAGTSFAISIMQSLSSMFYIIGLGAISIATYAVILVRFYRHFFTNQGYLTFTLPISATQHLICKFVVAISCVLATIVMIGASAQVNTLISMEAAELQSSSIKDLIELFNLIFPDENFVLFIVKYSVITIILLSTIILIIYTVLCVGQFFKNRIVASIIGFVIVYFANQIVNTVMFVLVINNLSDAMSSINYNLISLIYTLMYGIIGIVCFFVCRHILNNKLNLE